ncbi:potassium transporter Kup [Sphingomonadales bacterium 56]|uniref:potassium transporter Kup n=1 Tax=unclassified Sphingobium TaxID=2611147 RepID=UPI00191B10FE|nr:MULTISPECIES: potassium transporter Kup [unclassified Sphingobium]MBY2927514.1 potassium transporter Kup [Sphingomonadales bacterium 56]MBY2957614.1 potassium transporter Kup [Sphingomonadales bacterium 58]CAD7335378.1 Low affinity potassium transport system protein kup [Sphingobium sp. S6]CAD7335443.1 Low affinity potassium transport system protein kup [Sphingobium sp. S8]
MADKDFPVRAEGQTAHGPLSGLALGALGVVFGDIGTSPLYALKESFVGHHPLAVDPVHIYGVLSLIFWTMMLVVTVKYVFIILRADNNGEGGSMALLALIGRRMGETRWTPTIAALGVLATALFYGDAIITPAVSVLSAVEGLTVVEAGLTPLVLPIAIVILIALFVIQSIGTARVGALFGPIMVVYFLALAVLGAANILRHPEIVAIVNPWWALHFFLIDPKLAFLALGSVVLAVTGAEALYADMGHFGRRAISVAWLYAAFPCLMLNYLGQGALLIDEPAAAQNPFFLLAPEWARLPLVILATMATVIASQAVISGAFSVTRQAVQLGFLPRLRILHTSASAAGQIYMPLINWTLLVLVIMLVLGFGSSSNLAAAYGIAVTGTMVITTCMMAVLTFSVWRWNPVAAGLVIGLFLIVDGAYFLSNATKIPDGGWFPLLVAGVSFLVLTTWATGRRIMRRYLREDAMDLELFIKSAGASLKRVPGTAIFLSSTTEGVPPALLHNVKHNRILHERNIILTVRTEDVPHLPYDGRTSAEDHGAGFYRLILRHGFMENVDVPAAMKAVRDCGGPIGVADTSYFLSRETLVPSSRPGMAIWRERLFAWMVRNAESPMAFFKLPTNRVVELGSQLEI